MTHKTIVVCDRCSARAESIAGKPYPEGWALLGIKVFSYNDAGSPIGVKGDHDLCPKCMAGVRAILLTGPTQ